MTVAWSSEDLDQLGRAEELQIAGKNTDGTVRRSVPIWVVRFGSQIYVRTWHRRETGWFGDVLDSRRARIGVPGLEVDVAVEDIGDGPAEVRTGVDAAYRAKYGRYGGATVDRMTGPDAAATTLLLNRVEAETVAKD